MSPDLVRKLRASSVEIRGSDRGCGSGAIWSRDGLIVSNAHVVQSRDPLVVLSDGREFPAEVLRRDRRRDLALLRIHARDLPAVEIGDSDTLRVGQIVTAIGNPLGLAGAVSTGIVFSTSETNWIQADLRLAPGNSGGILADAQGRLIGINTMIYAGLALAIPSEFVAAFVRGSQQTRGAKAA